MSSIRDIWLKVKWAAEAAIEAWGLIVPIFLVAFASFGLGRLSATEAAKPVVSITEASVYTERAGMAVGGLVVASRNGSVYHYPWCGGASQIKRENQLWFTSEEAAEKAGYVPSKSCKGLVAD
ncbi:MAG TPA: Ada metal-binding domain-containing protein [Candidatus Paceibacterota bacterium]|nr:Ada metal-binding domain-containing protein [Candidatus Paceibacterota bacterium]